MSEQPDTEAPSYRRAFFGWGLAAYLATLGVVLALSLRNTGGTLVYVVDDAAIHLTVAGNLAQHGTWGVVPGQFQSASSSPMWTLALALFLLVAPAATTLVPLLLNVASAVWIIATIAANQRVLLPHRKRPLDVIAVAALVSVVLFLPGLTMLGMEHTLHTALMLNAVVLLARRADGGTDRWPNWLPYLLLGLATLARFETGFVAAGLGMAYVAQSRPGWSSSNQGATGDGRPAFSAQLRKAALVGIVAFVPFAGFAAFNRAMGQGFLPNSVLAKGQTINGAGNTFTLAKILDRFTADPALALIVAALLATLAITWGRGLRCSFGAVTVVVAAALHVTFAQVGWFERYQAYLVAQGAFVLLAAAGELVPATRRAPTRARLVPALVALVVLVSGTKIDLITRAPLAVSDTYQQRYQAGRFLTRYYQGQAIATGELGYIGLQHRGPVTDLYGLGDYAVLEARRQHDQRPGKAYWEQLTAERGFTIVAVYPTTLFETTPDSWVLVGEWHLDRGVVTAWEPTFQFFAANPDEVAPLEQHLKEFATDLPPGVRQTLNGLAGFRADAIRAERRGR